MKQSRLSKVGIASLFFLCLFVVISCGYQSRQAIAPGTKTLLGAQYPVKVLRAEEGIPICARVEGQDETIWRGNVTVSESDITADNSGTTYHMSDPTGLGALDEASNHEQRFSYYITDTYGALFVSSIAGEESQGASGWMYRVDYYSPSVGAGDFILNETTPPDPPHEEVLFYHGAWTDLPLKTTVDKIEVDVGENFAATVEVYSDDTHEWSPCEGATVHADQDYTTDSSGNVTISVDHDVTLHVFAEKAGYIRSDKIEVTVTPAPVTYILTLAVKGHGSTSPSAGSPYYAGTTVEISAASAQGWEFASWSGDVANSSSSSTTVTMDANKTVTAKFVQIPSVYTLTVTCKPSRGGSVTLSPTAEAIEIDEPSEGVTRSTHDVDTSIELTAIPAEGYTFGGWSGDLSRNSNPATITVDSNKSIIADFVLPAPKEPASFSTSQLNISPKQAQPNQQVNISINITNSGGEAGSYEAVLYINGQMEDSQTVSISPGSAQTVVFGITKAIPDTYAISLGEQQAQFNVIGNQVSDKGLDTGSTIAIVVIAGLIAALVLVFRRIKSKA